MLSTKIKTISIQTHRNSVHYKELKVLTHLRTSWGSKLFLTQWMVCAWLALTILTCHPVVKLRMNLFELTATSCGSSKPTFQRPNLSPLSGFRYDLTPMMMKTESISETLICLNHLKWLSAGVLPILLLWKLHNM
jgi:hypothetical protein